MLRKQFRALRLQRLSQAAKLQEAIQYVGGIMAVTLVEEYGWTVDEVEKLVGKMSERLKEERKNG